MKKLFSTVALITAAALSASAGAPRAASRPARARQSNSVPDFTNDKDQTLHAMQDELNRSKSRLVIPSVGKPYFIEYRLIDLDIREVSASFGAEVSSAASRTRSMGVDVRVGNYHLDSSNFVGGQGGFQGVFGNTGQVGIDRDYHSLRQDLWLATDEAYKSAAAQMSLKQAFLSSLTKPPEIDDFSQVPPTVDVEPRMEADWTSRNWEQEARQASAGLKKFPDLYGSHVNYYIIYATTYLMNSEGTVIRNSRCIAAVEAALDTQAEDGMPLHNFYSVDVLNPADLPDPATVAKGIEDAATQLTALREAPLVTDYTGPMLFDPRAAGSLIAQLVTPSLSGARPPLSSNTQFDQLMARFGGQSDWSGRLGTRVLPVGVSLIDDPAATNVQGQPLVGDYKIDNEGVKAQKVTIVNNGLLTGLLMTRRPGPDFDASNGHARAGNTQPIPSNLILQATNALDQNALQQKFIQACKDDGHNWCLEVQRMDNPALGAVSPGDAGDTVSQLAGGLSSGTRLPLMMYKVYVNDGHKELVRGGTMQDLTVRTLRNILGIGSDTTVYDYLQNAEDGLAGTALGAFGTVGENGIPSTVTTPSLLLEEVEVRGFHGEPRRLPIVPPPPMQ